MSTRSRSSRTAGSVAAVAAFLVAVVSLVLLPLGPASARGTDGTDGATPPGKAWVRAGNFVPGMSGVSIRLTPQSTGSSMTLAQQVSYGQVSAYRQVAPGSYTISVRPQGSDAASRPMLRRTMTVTAGKASTIALLGTSSAPRLATLSDDLTPPAAGTARVRVLSGSSEASDLSIKAVGGPQIASDVVLGQTTAYATVPKGNWTLALENAGMTTVDTSVDLASGGVYTAVVLDGDETNGGKVRVALVTDAQGVTTTPKGGAATGLGGTAGTTSGTGQVPVGLLVLAGVGVAGAALFGAGSFGTWRASRRAAAGR